MRWGMLLGSLHERTEQLASNYGKGEHNQDLDKIKKHLISLIPDLMDIPTTMKNLGKSWMN